MNLSTDATNLNIENEGFSSSLEFRKNEARYIFLSDCFKIRPARNSLVIFAQDDDQISLKVFLDKYCVGFSHV